jgi:hypothetical protein
MLYAWQLVDDDHVQHVEYSLSAGNGTAEVDARAT